MISIFSGFNSDVGPFRALGLLSHRFSAARDGWARRISTLTDRWPGTEMGGDLFILWPTLILWSSFCFFFVSQNCVVLRLPSDVSLPILRGRPCDITDPAEAFVVFERPTREQIQVLSRTFVAWQHRLPHTSDSIIYWCYWVLFSLAFSFHLKEFTVLPC